MEKIKLNTIEEAIEDFRKGEFVIIVDDEDRENEGDLVVAAELITPEKVNFMLKHARGVLCAPITISRCEELDLPQVYRLPTAPQPSVPWLTRLPNRKHSVARDMSTPCMHKKKVYYAAQDIQKPA